MQQRMYQVKVLGAESSQCRSSNSAKSLRTFRGQELLYSHITTHFHANSEDRPIDGVCAHRLILVVVDSCSPRSLASDVLSSAELVAYPSPRGSNSFSLQTKSHTPSCTLLPTKIRLPPRGASVATYFQAIGPGPCCNAGIPRSPKTPLQSNWDHACFVLRAYASQTAAHLLMDIARLQLGLTAPPDRKLQEVMGVLLSCRGLFHVPSPGSGLTQTSDMGPWMGPKRVRGRQICREQTLNHPD